MTITKMRTLAPKEKKLTIYLSIVLYILKHLSERLTKNSVFSPFSSDSISHLFFSLCSCVARLRCFCTFAGISHFNGVFFPSSDAAPLYFHCWKLHWRLHRTSHTVHIHNYCFYSVNRMHWHCFIHGYCADRYCVAVFLFFGNHRCVSITMHSVPLLFFTFLDAFFQFILMFSNTKKWSNFRFPCESIETYVRYCIFLHYLITFFLHVCFSLCCTLYTFFIHIDSEIPRMPKQHSSQIDC